ncbi:MAG: ammonium transporter [Actinobacteria bacterium]|nr:ammonium transporter [Actinomycetota bacterium]
MPWKGSPMGEVATVEQINALADTVTVVWVGVAAALVFLMQAGFALVEAGLTRAKNAANIVAKNLADMSVGAVAYWAVGAALAYGASSGGLFGTSGFFAPIGEGAPFGDGVQFIFQLVFAATAATIVSGAVAERMRFAGYLIVSVAITALIYPIVTHWQWLGEGGWLYDRGYYDFAGSSLVHMVGGVAGLVGALVIGPRIGKYGKDGRPRAIPGHNLPFVVVGVFVLWFGWFGFNGGSTLGIGNATDGFLGGSIGNILTTTTLAAAAGALAAGAVIWMISKKPDVAMAANGALAGLVGITAGPDYASPAAAVLVGLICGAVVVISVIAFDRLKVDDPVGAVSVHGVCGAIGVLAVPFYGAAPETITLGTQALGAGAIAAFVASASAVVFLLVKATIGVRVAEDVEIDGLDVHEHGVAGYPDALGPVGVPATPPAVSVIPAPARPAVATE